MGNTSPKEKPSNGGGKTGDGPTAVLDPKVQERLRKIWTFVKENDDLERLGALHYAKFLDKGGAAARKLFIGTNMTKQQHAITPVVEWILSNPDNGAVHALAVYHCHLGVTPEQLRVFCQCFVEALMEILGPAGDEEIRKMWTQAFSGLADAIGEELVKCTKAIKAIGDDRSQNMASKLYAHKMMRIKTQATNLPDFSPDQSGWLKVSMYGKNHIKSPKTSAQHDTDYFKPRWCELRGQYLYYRVHQYDKPEGVVDLQVCELIDTSMPSSKLPSPSPFSFALKSYQSPDYPWYFITNGDDDKEAWFAKLRRACNRFSFIRSDLYNGQRVRVALDEQIGGVCMWTGKHEFEQGLWVGVETDEALPDGHDGMHMGKRYYSCKKGHGLMVPAFRCSAASPLEIQVQGGHLPTNTYTPAQFEFIKVIGKGSFGRVCKVRENSTGKIYAVKILQKAALLKESQITNIRREKTILLNISHPFIVKLHAAFQTRGRLFLLFDFLTGGELFHYVQSCPGSHLKENDAKFYAAEVALAVGHLHSLNIIHRDLKAENLVLDKEGHCVLTDFGFAKTVLPTEQNTTRCGTLPYMAPEILKQGPMGYGFEVDWWALGVLVFLLLTGCYPFWNSDPREAMKQILNRQIKVTTFPIRPKLSIEARKLVLRLIEKDPTMRLASIEDFKKDPWYANDGFDWEGCLARKLTPPFVPDVTGPNTKYFDLEEGDAGQSKPLPAGWSRDEAFASFYDVHDDYKKASQVGSKEKSSDQEENERFIENLNRWSHNSSDAHLRDSPQLRCMSPDSFDQPTQFVIDT
eukprot:TRINITY_DN711_c0_g1_i2.p1 TRINITY_DN711_c0_g1~~TRINITY_DN711_c0_g1_i2.p1  ORF type:complete len:815 (+),score=225.68 TRINITY_DN711_c0_g1_i2:37-2445(+)